MGCFLFHHRCPGFQKRHQPVCKITTLRRRPGIFQRSLADTAEAARIIPRSVNHQSILINI